jgi:hypothetical protein
MIITIVQSTLAAITHFGNHSSNAFHPLQADTNRSLMMESLGFLMVTTVYKATEPV